MPNAPPLILANEGSPQRSVAHATVPAPLWNTGADMPMPNALPPILDSITNELIGDFYVEL
jgi:hypothetical protein